MELMPPAPLHRTSDHGDAQRPIDLQPKFRHRLTRRHQVVSPHLFVTTTLSRGSGESAYRVLEQREFRQSINPQPREDVDTDDQYWLYIQIMQVRRVQHMHSHRRPLRQ